jgi:hypothetical protein
MNSSMDLKPFCSSACREVLVSTPSRCFVAGSSSDGAAARHRLRHEFLRCARHPAHATHDRRLKLRRLVPVKLIPGTLNVGHTLPVIAQAVIYTRPCRWTTTLVLMIVAAVTGSWLGAGRRAQRAQDQIGMGSRCSPPRRC